MIDICSATWSEIGFGKDLILDPSFVAHQAT
jgi:hypothetical protein